MAELGAVPQGGRGGRQHGAHFDWGHGLVREEVTEPLTPVSIVSPTCPKPTAIYHRNSKSQAIRARRGLGPFLMQRECLRDRYVLGTCHAQRLSGCQRQDQNSRLLTPNQGLFKYGSKWGRSYRRPIKSTQEHELKSTNAYTWV